MTELQINVNDNGVGQVLEEVEDDDDVGDFAGIPEDTDEEYVPIAEPSSLSPSTSTARKRKAACKTDKNENGEAAEDDKKDSVQCPICDKSFKSKYYLKVHNRYATLAVSLQFAVERIATDVSFPQAAYRGEAVWLPQMWKEVLQEGESLNTRDQRLCQSAGE